MKDIESTQNTSKNLYSNDRNPPIDSNPKSILGNRKCLRALLGNISLDLGCNVSSLDQIRCDNMLCTKCDRQVRVIDKYMFTNNVD
mmetsp:Transcript_32250/g.27210  ORF Transcript_32250/g.27210 Transcript_32250/m.27210 type:complete len:86 (+) Transcript_32250:207-464(+)